MKSHTCEFSPRALLPLVLWPLVPLVMFTVAMHLGVQLKLLPAPRPTLDTERTVLIHQADAARSRQDAEIILLGDSSCLMNISARQLSETLGRRVLNLGTFSFLDVKSHAAMLGKYSEANPGRLRTVILLMHPETLRRLSAEAYYVDVMENFWAGTESSATDSLNSQINRLLGLEIFKGRLLARTLPIPLGGPYGRRYGFSRDLEKHLTDHAGSAFDPDPQPLTGSAEYRLGSTLEKASLTFRSAIPPNVRLLAGITPAPERFAGTRYPGLQRSMLTKWAGWLGATPLTNLPPALPDVSFVRTTHLTESGVYGYTSALAAELKPFLQ